ncbi:nucleoside hydrolase [Lacrimispora sp.]|uniref:nucleoside hydrolase n=1 Tax=Lacrimispora sp. TaxID=2719234 RepID=UPI0032E43213
MKPKKVIIDTDLGDDVDDAVAVALAVLSPEIEVAGITTVFKDTKARAEMVKDLLEFYQMGRIPVYTGQGLPLIERPKMEKPIQYSILRNEYEPEQSLNAVDFMIKTAAENDNVCIVAMGPLTNLGLAFLKAPEIMKRVEIIGMGGAFLNSYPEWNIICDPEAARIVTDFAENLTMLGLDVTKHTKLTTQEMEVVKNSVNPAVQYLYKGMEIFMDKTGFPITLHDALLIACLIDRETVTLKKGDYTVELKGELTRGTIVHKTNYYDEVCETEKDFYYAVDLDLQRFKNIVMERVFR